MKIFLFVLIIVILLWTLASYIAVRKIEEPTFSVVKKWNGYEVRNYAPYIVAEVEVSGDQKTALNQGFRLLAGYIFWGNTTKQSIAMTVPVSQTPLSEKIAMTAPVSESKSENGMRKVTFSMPSSYTLETLPKPNNSQVKLKEISSETRAVLTYSRGSSESRVQSKKQALWDMLNRDGVTSTGSFSSHSYNPPFTIPFLKRNEVSIVIIN
jgi:SOUL heme-binding protein